MEDRKQLLPEREYRAWDKAEVDERTRTMGLLLKFNTTGDREILEEVFGRDLDGVTVFAPLHCNYGDSRVKFGSRVFINTIVRSSRQAVWRLAMMCSSVRTCVSTRPIIRWTRKREPKERRLCVRSG